MERENSKKITDAKENEIQAPLVSIVDDDLSIRRSAQRLLRLEGFRTEAFASAEEFLASGFAGQTACIVLDLRMPGMNGLQLQRHLAEASNPASIVFLTARLSRFSEDEKRQASQLGNVQFLEKPVIKEVLLLAVRNALKTWANDERRTS
jgi:FixJ family two-component response regulator